MSGTDRKVALKRKRGSAPLEENLGTKILGKLHHGAKEVRKAAKKAKTFETQKLVKKLKGARTKDSKGAEIVELEIQLEILKNLDHEPFGNTALKTKMNKDRTLSENENVSAAISKELSQNLVTPAPAGSSAAKVHGRLLSSKALAAEVVVVINSLKNVINPPPKVLINAEDDLGNVEEDDISGRPRKIKKVVSADVNSSDAGSDNDGEGSDAASDIERRFDFSEDDGVDDGGWESGSVDEGGGSSSDEEGGVGESEDGDDDTDPTPVPRKSLEKSKTSTSKPSDLKGSSTSNISKVSESTFLPSLSVGFTRGDSDASDWSGDETGAADVGPKKNRRGQRARRAIWEKKYGKNANHVKKEHENSAKVARHPPGRSGNPRNNGPTRPQSHDKSAPSAYAAGDDMRPRFQAPVDKSQREDKPLHPSWEAKRRLKEKQNPTIIPAQGKKITFS